MQYVDTSRRARRQELSSRIAKSGSRVAFEAFRAIARGEDLDWVLEDFGRIPPRFYHALLYRAAALSDGEVA